MQPIRTPAQADAARTEHPYPRFMFHAFFAFLIIFGASHAYGEKAGCGADGGRAVLLCEDKIFGSFLQNRKCYRQRERADCRAAFAECVKTCTGKEFVYAPEADEVPDEIIRETPYMRALRAKAGRSAGDRYCTSDSQCAAAVLLNGEGCRTYLPFSVTRADEEKMHVLVNAYNHMMLKLRRDNNSPQSCAGARRDPRPYCAESGDDGGICEIG